jgi:hypothetical protein
VLLSDLLRLPVIDADGESLGRIDDVRLVQDGPFVEGFGAALRVADLIVGPGGLGVRLGYVRHGVRGPAPIRALASRLERRTIVVAWEHVDAWRPGDDHVTLKVSRASPLLTHPLGR